MQTSPSCSSNYTLTTHNFTFILPNPTSRFKKNTPSSSLSRLPVRLALSQLAILQSWQIRFNYLRHSSGFSVTLGRHSTANVADAAVPLDNRVKLLGFALDNRASQRTFSELVALVFTIYTHWGIRPAVADEDSLQCACLWTTPYSFTGQLAVRHIQYLTRCRYYPL